MSHHRNSSSDELFASDLYFSQFTEEDFKKIDEAVATAWEGTSALQTKPESFPSKIDVPDLNTKDSAKLAYLSDIEDSVEDNEEPLNRSFASEIDGLNLATLTTEELEKLDTFISENYFGSGGPSISISPENLSGEATAMHAGRAKDSLSPLRQFRRKGVLSVTDLSYPTWYVLSFVDGWLCLNCTRCEVQFEYGLRGKRNRPLDKRPAAFKSASGKTISAQQKVAQKNDIRVRQGLVRGLFLLPIDVLMRSLGDS
jgi:exonuclease V